jgi:hypothetical protein
MVADVGAIEEWVRGSKPKLHTPRIIDKVGKIVGGKHRYIAGHLLNQEMGGLGENKNLTVLSSDANKKHTGIEGGVKKLATEAGQIARGVTVRDSSYEYGVKYTVEVLPSRPSGDHPYNRLERKLSSGLKVSVEPIRKSKESGKTTCWQEKKSDTKNVIVPNVPPYPPVPVKGNPTKLEKEIMIAISSLKSKATEATPKEILKFINADRPNLQSATLRGALTREVRKQLWRVVCNEYRLLVSV